jgi:ribosomal protein S27AE
MAFIKMHPCPRCNSRDNLAEYHNGFYCFGCGYTKSKIKRLDERTEVKTSKDITLTKNLNRDALKWLLGYNLTKDEIDKFYFAEKYGKNLLVLYADANYWVARNMDDGIKYLSSGEKPFIKFGDGNTLVFVEDIISAIKVGRQYTAVPMLGSKPKTDWWKYAQGYDKVVIWGDRDKATDNIRLARKAREITGKQVQTIITEKDPKEYNNEEIKNILTRLF